MNLAAVGQEQSFTEQQTSTHAAHYNTSLGALSKFARTRLVHIEVHMPPRYNIHEMAKIET
jgi:hypothetical protein